MNHGSLSRRASHPVLNDQSLRRLGHFALFGDRFELILFKDEKSNLRQAMMLCEHFDILANDVCRKARDFCENFPYLALLLEMSNLLVLCSEI